MFEIKCYNDEQDPDVQSDGESYQELPAIAVVSKHDDKILPIQYYSFALRSISDRKIGILRIYAEDEIAEQTREKCQQLFSDEFNNRINEIKRTQAELEVAQQQERKLKDKLIKLEDDTY